MNRSFLHNQQLARATMLGTTLCALHVRADAAMTSPPPAQVVFVPDASATRVAKHPTLPVLYVCTPREPKAINLVTYKLNSDGTLIAGSECAFGHGFTANGTNTLFTYSFHRPCVLTEEKVLLLGASPGNISEYYAHTNNQEFATVALDEEGLPTKIVRSFRLVKTYPDYLMGMQWDATTHRLYLAYYVYIGWVSLDRNGLPVDSVFHPIPGPINQWYWAYVPHWQRFFIMPPSPTLTLIKLTADGLNLDHCQLVAALRGPGARSHPVVNEKSGKLYLLDADPNGELAVCSLTGDGHLTGVPRYLPLGETSIMRFDFKAGLLYAAAPQGILRIFRLDANGYPAAGPTIHRLNCGEIRDLWVDETTGKVFVVSSQPPGTK